MVSRIVVGMEVLCVRPTFNGYLVKGGHYTVSRIRLKYFGGCDALGFRELPHDFFLADRFISWPDEIELLARTERAVEHHKMLTKQGRGGGTNPGSVTLTYGADGQWLITNTFTS